MVRYTDMFTELVRVEIELWNGLDDHLSSTVGVTLPQFQALAAVRLKLGTVRVQDLSAEMFITVGATSKVVDRLERDGFAVRSAHPSDRRSSLITLTQRGSDALAAADLAAEAHLRDVLGTTLPDDNVSGLLSILTSLRANERMRVAQ